VLAVGDADFQRKCLGKNERRSQTGPHCAVSSAHMSAILRLTQETLVIVRATAAARPHGREAVDFYLSRGPDPRRAAHLAAGRNSGQS
jgi:ABC-type polysaccharide/polyol phosphate transport system ATPase subunit